MGKISEQLNDQEDLYEFHLRNTRCPKVVHSWIVIKTACLVESCAGRVNPRGLRVPAFAGRVREPALLCVRVWVVLAAGAGRARVEKFFVRVTECWAKARELNQLKNR